MPTKQLRDLPSVDRLLGAPELQALASEHSQGLVVAAIRQVLAQARSRVQAGGVLPAHPELVQAAVAGVMVQVRPSLGQVINATGVILHTNLGRGAAEPVCGCSHPNRGRELQQSGVRPG